METNEDSEEEEEEMKETDTDSDEEEEEVDGWSMIFAHLYPKLLSENTTDNGNDAKQILKRKDNMKIILDRLRKEVEYVIKSHEALQDDKLFEKWKNSRDKLVDEDEYTAEEASILSWKNRKVSMKELIEKYADILEAALKEKRGENDDENNEVDDDNQHNIDDDNNSDCDKNE
ncbi:MAG: hypothetical protein GY820_10330 [Gammaproteobacteria bacterium]|nr:hypothetical protein [Gammaproteobacteria bacterium]